MSSDIPMSGGIDVGADSSEGGPIPWPGGRRGGVCAVAASVRAAPPPARGRPPRRTEALGTEVRVSLPRKRQGGTMRLSRMLAGGAVVAGLALFVGVQPAPAVSNTDVVNLSGFGDPLQGIRNEVAFGIRQRLEQFADGQIEFVDVEAIPRGGPIFNSKSCGACHFQPAVGGSGEFINEVRIRNNTAGGPLHIFANDNVLRLGPQTQGGLTIFPTGVAATPIGCQITSPNCTKSACQTEEATRTTFATTLRICDTTTLSFANGQNCTAERQSTPLFGFGFVEAVADATFDAIAAGQPAAIRGTVKRVTEFGRTRVARFGWKDDVATLRNFASDAYLNEMGITNPDRPNEL